MLEDLLDWLVKMSEREGVRWSHFSITKNNFPPAFRCDLAISSNESIEGVLQVPPMKSVSRYSGTIEGAAKLAMDAFNQKPE